MSTTNTPTLITDRLVLRKFVEDDINALFTILSDEEVNAYLPWFPLHSMEEAAVFFKENYEKVYKQPNGYSYAVCLRANNVPIGYVGVGGGDSYDLGYGLKKEYWYMGIVSEACRAIVEQIKTSGIPYITATHDVNNPRSGKVMKNIGMKYCYTYEELWKPKDILVLFRLYQLNFNCHIDRVYKKYWDNSSIRFIEQGAV